MSDIRKSISYHEYCVIDLVVHNERDIGTGVYSAPFPRESTSRIKLQSNMVHK